MTPTKKEKNFIRQFVFWAMCSLFALWLVAGSLLLSSSGIRSHNSEFVAAKPALKPYPAGIFERWESTKTKKVWSNVRELMANDNPQQEGNYYGR